MVGLGRVELPTNGLGNQCPCLGKRLRTGIIPHRSRHHSRGNISCFGMRSNNPGESSSSSGKNGGSQPKEERITF